MAILKPWPGAPSNCARGTRQSSKRRVASGCGAISSMRSAISRPGVLASTIKADRPFAAGASPVRANTT